MMETWTWGLLNAIVVGGSTSISSWLGMAAAHGAGIDVPVLNFKALGVVFLSGAGVKFFAYLSAGIPALTKTVDTSYFKQEPDGSVVSQSSKTVEVVPTPAKSGLTSTPPTPTVEPQTNQTPTP